MLKSFFSPVNILYSRNQISDIQKLTFLSILFMGFLLFSANYYFDPGAHLFIKYAEAIAHGKSYLNANTGERDIMYPLLFILSGYTFHHSLIGLAILNAITAILIPILIYLTVKPALPKGAYYIALVAIFSLLPFYYVKSINHDHPFIFFNLLSMCFLSLFIYKKRSRYLFAMTLAAIAASLVRPAGNIMFPFFILMAILYGRGPYLKYIVCILIGIIALSAYKYHRHQFFSQFGDNSNTSGAQVFYNLYLNSKDFGIQLSPDLGTNMKKITESVYNYKKSLKHGQSDQNNQLGKDMELEKFNQNFVYPFSPDVFVMKIYQMPCWEYWRIICEDAAQNDHLLLNASFEIIKHYPWYPIAYTARNIWHLLYTPGYAFTRYNTNSLTRTGVNSAFIFDHTDVINLNYVSSRGLNEIQFDTLQNKPLIIGKFFHYLKVLFEKCYFFITKILFYLMLVAWTAALLPLINRFISSKKLESIIDLLPKSFNPLIVTLSIYLFLNMAIVSAFVDPMVRYHNHLLLFKIMLAGIGLGILINLFIKNPTHSYYSSSQRIHYADLQKYKFVTYLLTLMSIALFMCWSFYILIHT